VCVLREKRLANRTTPPPPPPPPEKAFRDDTQRLDHRWTYRATTVSVSDRWSVNVWWTLGGHGWNGKKKKKIEILYYSVYISYLFLFFQTFCVCFIPQKNSRENTRDWKSRQYYVGLHTAT
jgi:hypothetical protein